MTKILIANRLCAPRPLYKVEEWAEKSGVEAVFGIPSHYLNDDKCGRTLEVFADNAQTLKAAISLDVARRFNIGLEHTHWDLTTVHFEGEYENQDPDAIQIVYTKDNPKEHNINKSIKIGLDVANDGKGPIPIFYEALSGNASGFVETIRNMENLKKLKNLFLIGSMFPTIPIFSQLTFISIKNQTCPIHIYVSVLEIISLE